MVCRKDNNKRIKGFAYYRKAWLESLQGQPDEAVKNILASLKLLESTDAYNYMARNYYVLTGIYGKWKDLENQKKYARLCLQAAQKSGDLDELTLAYQVMETSYHYRYRENKKNTSLLDSAILYDQYSIKLFKNHKDRIIFRSHQAVVALNLSNLYREYFPSRYQDTVTHYLEIALKVALESKQLVVVSNCYGMMSDDQLHNGKYKEAESLLLAGLTVCASKRRGGHALASRTTITSRTPGPFTKRPARRKFTSGTKR